MKALVLVLSTLVISGAALADSLRELPVYQNEFILPGDAGKFQAYYIRVTQVPSVMRDLEVCRPAAGVDSDLVECSEVAQKTKVVQVTYVYDSGSMTDDSTSTLDVNFPIESFSAADLAAIEQTNKGFLDILGKKARANSQILKRLIRFETLKFKSSSSYRTCDYETCDENDYYTVNTVGTNLKIKFSLAQ